MPDQANTGWLSESETERYRRIPDRLQSQQYLLSRCYIRDILSAYLDCEPGTIALDTEAGGKPYIRSPARQLCFNLSHTDDKALLALSQKMSIGVDLERIRPLEKALKISRRIFTPGEQEQLARTADADRAATFFKLWTSMEARQKTKGQGIFASRVQHAAVGTRQLAVLDGYCAAVAWDNAGLQPGITCYRYAPENEDGYHSAINDKNDGQYE